ncbi:hypothetical protein Ga0466249_002208 [Sporomusaceae bacterium BoRhaA]|uniref:hypothetical protein n=1 Tax=Pelorhabdus rhamnosifermentans TaxID=2772457 RepID=UPI001C060289|nr:hypothetical protein [Pelorhabdus rhamnosifermentans]MBU2701097.1 hypothetical protein [Pelorhabdus rhamnosifermentans]
MKLSRQEEIEYLVLLEDKQKRKGKNAVNDFIYDFAKLNLEIVKNLLVSGDYTPELLRELRKNAQALQKLI